MLADDGGSYENLSSKNRHWALVVEFIVARLSGDEKHASRKRECLERYDDINDLDAMYERQMSLKLRKRKEFNDRISELREVRDQLYKVYVEKKQTFLREKITMKKGHLTRYCLDCHHKVREEQMQRINQLDILIKKSSFPPKEGHILKVHQLLTQCLNFETVDEVLQEIGADGAMEVLCFIAQDMQRDSIGIDLRCEGERMVNEFVAKHNRYPVTLQKAVLGSIDGQLATFTPAHPTSEVADPRDIKSKITRKLSNDIGRGPRISEALLVNYSNAVNNFNTLSMEFTRRVNELINEISLFNFPAQPQIIRPNRIPQIDIEYFVVKALKEYVTRNIAQSSETQESHDNTDKENEMIKTLQKSLADLKDQVEISGRYLEDVKTISAIPLYKLSGIAR